MKKYTLALALAVALSAPAMAATYTYHQYVPLFFGGATSGGTGTTTTPSGGSGSTTPTVPTTPDETITLSNNGTGNLPNATIDTPYAFDMKTLVTTSGADATSVNSLTWSIGSGALPSGLSLLSNGYISGQPLNTSGGTFQVVATSVNTSGQQVYTIMVNGVAALQASSLSSNQYHTCAITTAGGAKCWGSNAYAQLGTGDTTNRGIPTDVVGLTSGVSKIVAGGMHTCAITTAGGLKCWGGNGYGQLGPVVNNTSAAWKSPQDVTGFTSGIVDVSLGYDFTCALRSTGQVQCWGNRAASGQLGDNMTSGYTATPVQASTLISGSGVVALSGNSMHTCALFNTGGIKCWGYNTFGQLGANGTTSTNIPQQVAGLTSGVAEVRAGYFGTCARTTAGEVKCWGNRAFMGSVAPSNTSTPTTVTGLASGATKLYAGYQDACAIKSDGTSVCWQYNVPADPGFGSPIVGMSVGRDSKCAILASGNTKCVGADTYGQLGDNAATTPTTTTPVYVYGN